MNTRWEGVDRRWREASRWVRFQEDVEECGERWSKPHVPANSFLSFVEFRRGFASGPVVLNAPGGSVRDVVVRLRRGQGENRLPLTDAQLASLNRLLVEDTEMRVRTRLLNRVSSLATGGRGDSVKALMKFSSSSFSSSRSQTAAAPEKESRPDGNPFGKKVPKGSESCVILASTVDFVEEPLVIWMRLKDAAVLRQFCEIADVSPTRFVAVILRPLGETKMATEVGKVLGALMSDQIFAKVAYGATSKEELTDELDAFMNDMTVLAPSTWDPTVRLDPPETLPSVETRLASCSSRRDGVATVRIREGVESEADELHGLMECDGAKKVLPADPKDGDEGAEVEEEEEDRTLKRTGRLFGGLVEDVRRKIPWYGSDFTDALSPQTVASVIYIYLATVTKAITFGGFLSDITDGVQGVLEAFLGHALAGGLFCLFGGQPLTVVGCTGPVLIFENILVDTCAGFGLDYITARLWIGLWASLFCIVIVATDASVFVRYFTRFTEESFAALIGIIFIIESLSKLFKMSKTYRVRKDFDLEHLAFQDDNCRCLPPVNMSVATTKLEWVWKNDEKTYNMVSGRVNESTVSVDTIPWNRLEMQECEMFGGHLSGIWCDYVPDVFFFSVLLFFGTFITATYLKRFKSTSFFPMQVRSMISNYAIIIAILAFVMFDNAFHLQTPKLIVPTVFKPTRSDLRGWIIPFVHESFGWYVYPLTSVPALLLTILLFMDQQITSVIVNRKEHKLRKGCGYHLDMLMIGVTMGACSVLGLPWCVAATVLCLGHVDSLKMETPTRAPGERPRFLGIREQRVTGIAVFVLTGLSVKLAPVLKFIPMPVLYGVLLYMGVASLKGMQLLDRIALAFMPSKYQPDHEYLRQVPLFKVHLFTIVQVAALVLLWIIKSTKASLIFPLMVLALVGFRKAMDFFPKVFSQNDLYWLDSLMPDSKANKRRKKVEMVMPATTTMTPSVQV